jgi:YjbE family integral membrane protein
MSSSADFGALLAALLVPIQILAVDLLLSADNALVIAMASREFPEQEAKLVAFGGTLGAIALRLVMASAVVILLQTPGLKIIAGLALLPIALRLTLAPADAATLSAVSDMGAGPANRGKSDVLPFALGPICVIIAADAIMSLDNVVALAAIAGGSLFLLGFGLALSIPMLIWGSTLIRRFLNEHKFVITASGMFLGWLAGSIGVSDPIVATWIAGNAPALPFAVPLACALFVLWQTLIVGPQRAPERF